MAFTVLVLVSLKLGYRFDKRQAVDDEEEGGNDLDAMEL